MPHAPGLSGSQRLGGCTSWDSVSSLFSVRTVSTGRKTVSVADTAAEFPLSKLFCKGSVEAVDGSRWISYILVSTFLTLSTLKYNVFVIKSVKDIGNYVKSWNRDKDGCYRI